MKLVSHDIFASKCQTLVNPVNTVGVMGKGLALDFKKRFPSMFERYRRACASRQLRPGRLLLASDTTPWVLCFPTKQHWRDPSTLAIVEAGLAAFVNTHAAGGIRSAAFPKLGCGLGGLRWEVVQPLMMRYLEPLPIDIEICSM